MGLRLDFSNIGVGLGLLGEALAKRKERKKLQTFQTGTSLFNRLTDPTLDVEERNKLKMELAQVMKMEDASNIPDDMSEFAGQMDTLFRSQFPEIASSAMGNSMISNIVESARNNEKLADLATSILNMPGMDNENKQTMQVFIDAGNYEVASQYGLGLINERSGILNRGKANLDLQQSDIGRTQLNQNIEDAWINWNLFGFPTYVQQMQAQLLLSGGGRGGGGGGGGGGGKIRKFDDVFDEMEARVNDSRNMINTANTEITQIAKERQTLLDVSGDYVGNLDAITEGRWTSENGGTIDDLTILKFLNENGNNAELAYTQLNAIYPDLSTDEWMNLVNTTVGKYDPSQRQFLLNYADLDAREASAKMNIAMGTNQARMVKSSAEQLMQSILAGEASPDVAQQADRISALYSNTEMLDAQGQTSYGRTTKVQTGVITGFEDDTLSETDIVVGNVVEGAENVKNTAMAWITEHPMIATVLSKTEEAVKYTAEHSDDVLPFPFNYMAKGVRKGADAVGEKFASFAQRDAESAKEVDMRISAGQSILDTHTKKQIIEMYGTTPDKFIKAVFGGHKPTKDEYNELLKAWSQKMGGQ